MKQDIRPINNKVQQHGLWICYDLDDSLFYKGQYVNGIRHGYFIDYWKSWTNPEITFFIK